MRRRRQAGGGGGLGCKHGAPRSLQPGVRAPPVPPCAGGAAWCPRRSAAVRVARPPGQPPGSESGAAPLGSEPAAGPSGARRWPGSPARPLSSGRERWLVARGASGLPGSCLALPGTRPGIPGAEEKRSAGRGWDRPPGREQPREGRRPLLACPEEPLRLLRGPGGSCSWGGGEERGQQGELEAVEQPWPLWDRLPQAPRCLCPPLGSLPPCRVGAAAWLRDAPSAGFSPEDNACLFPDSRGIPGEAPGSKLPSLGLAAAGKACPGHSVAPEPCSGACGGAPRHKAVLALPKLTALLGP